MTKDLIKCTISEYSGYLSDSPIGSCHYFIDGDKLVISYQFNTFQLFEFKNTGYKILTYKGYILQNSCIACVDDSNTVLEILKGEGSNVIREAKIEVPEGCTKILYFCLPDYVDKFSIQAFNTVEYDVTSYISDFDSLEIEVKRDGTSGAISEVSLPINLVDAGKDFLKGIFERRGLYGGGILSIYKRGDFDNEYTLLKQINLDFSTYKEYEDKVTIEAAKTDLAEVINSVGKTKYDIPVEEIKDSKQWKNEGFRISNNADYETPLDTSLIALEVNEKKNAMMSLSLSMNSSELAPGIDVDFKDEATKYQEIDYFVKNNTDETIQLKIDSRIYVDTVVMSFDSMEGNTAYQNLRSELSLRDYDSSGNYTNIINDISIPMLQGQTGSEPIYQSVVSFTNNIVQTLNVSLAPGHKIGLFLSFYKNNGNPILLKNGGPQYTERDGQENKFFVSFLSKNPKPVNIDVIDPLTLMQAFLDKMSGHSGTFQANIEWEDEPATVKIIAAESIRQLENATFHGSPNDFFDWMRVLGYEYDIDGSTLNFKRRDKLFQKVNTALRMQEGEVADLIIQADSTHAYTSVEIGYEKQDYDSVTGKCEANGTYSYTTGYVARDDNKLSLISPYRADPVGIEMLRNEVLKDTADTDSDNDVFFVGFVENDDYYSVFDDIVMRDEFANVDDMYNACYNPYFLVQRNMSLIGINTDKLIFQATDMGRTAYLYNKKTGAIISTRTNQSINKKLFDPVEYNFAAGSWKNLPAYSVQNGLIRFEWKGEQLQGFIKEIRKNYATESETTWVLHAVR